MVREMKTQFENDSSVRELNQLKQVLRSDDLSHLTDEPVKPASGSLPDQR